MDSNEPTAWEEINPVTVSAPPQGRPLQYSGLDPATDEQFRDELTACLALVVPVGMTEEGRREWLAVAWATLKHLPPDLLAAGCTEARKSSDHPSKIVPAIIAYAEPRLESRARFEREFPTQVCLPPPPKHVMERKGQPMNEADTAELNRILESLGAWARYRPDGSRYDPATGQDREPND